MKEKAAKRAMRGTILAGKTGFTFWLAQYQEGCGRDVHHGTTSRAEIPVQDMHLCFGASFPLFSSEGYSLGSVASFFLPQVR